MKGNTLICLLLTLILVLMGAQAFVLWQRSQALEASLACALDDLSAMKESVQSIAGMSDTLNGIVDRFTQEGGLLGFLRQP